MAAMPSEVSLNKITQKWPCALLLLDVLQESLQSEVFQGIHGMNLDLRQSATFLSTTGPAPNGYPTMTANLLTGDGETHAAVLSFHPQSMYGRVNTEAERKLGNWVHQHHPEVFSSEEIEIIRIIAVIFHGEPHIIAYFDCQYDSNQYLAFAKGNIPEEQLELHRPVGLLWEDLPGAEKETSDYIDRVDLEFLDFVFLQPQGIVTKIRRYFQELLSFSN